MNEKTNGLLFALLRCAIQNRKLLEEETALYEAALLPPLYELSKKHDLAGVVGYALDLNGLLAENEPVVAKFQKQMMVAVFRCERLQYELTEICRAFDEIELPYVPLKGSVIRRYYAEPWLRTSCDIDILIHECDVARAKEHLLEKLGYREESVSSHDVSLYSASGVHLELHFKLNEPTERVYDKLDEVWDYVTPSSDSPYRYEMCDEMFYFYHIAHMAKHFLNGGCGIRPLMDLWILEHAVEHDADARNALLASSHLLDFAHRVRELCEVWFGSSVHDGVSRKMENYLLSGGVYGTRKNNITMHQVSEGGHIRYALRKIFLPYETLKYHYPILQRHRWLTPFMEVRRWCKLIFCGHAKRTLRELKLSGNISAEEARDTGDFLKKIGL